MAPCTVCGREFPHHFVLTARARSRWRGKSFDADAAQGEMGLAMMQALHLSPHKREDFATFQRNVHVTVARETDEDNPPEHFDAAEGEAYEFHVALPHPTPPETVDALKKAALSGLKGARGFTDARVAHP